MAASPGSAVAGLFPGWEGLSGPGRRGAPRKPQEFRKTARPLTAGRIEVLARGAEKARWHKWQVAPNGTWSGWKSEGGWIDRLDVAQNAL